MYPFDLNNNLVSVIIPTYNYDLDRIAKALQSVFDQTYIYTEVVICDDGSPNPLIQFQSELLDKCQNPNNMKVLFTSNEENKGISAARNSAVRVSHGKWLVWLDDDDTLAVDCIEQLLKYSEGKTMVIGECVVNENGLITRRKPKSYFEEAKKYFRTEKDPFLLNIISIQPQLVLRKTFDEVNGFNEAFLYAELTEFFLRYLLLKGIDTLNFIEEAVYHYDRTREGSHTKHREELQRFRIKALDFYLNNLDFNKSKEINILYLFRDSKTSMQKYKLNKKMIKELGVGVFLSSETVLKGAYKINHYSVIGSKSDPKPTYLGKNIEIGSFCIIEDNVVIGDNVAIDHHCSIYRGVKIGSGSKILYGARIFANSILGEECIVGSDIPERMILGSRVTFMGQVAHSYRNASLDWDTTDEPSPSVGDGSIIGVNALILGDIYIGKNCYIAAGEVLKHDLPDNTVYLKGTMIDINKMKGLIKTRF